MHDIFSLRSTHDSARRGSLRLTHGVVETPTFMPVGTAATVKALTPDEVRSAHSQIILANTYHLWLRPGRETIVEAGGLHRFMAWDGPILTDSGGFQVFSLQGRRKLDDDGVTFQSHIDGSTHRFTPETVIAFEEALGVDVAMVLDVCVKLPATREQLAESVRMTTTWAQRSREAWQSEKTAVFAIMQGGLDVELREQSARELVALDFPGYAIGGLSVGETREEMYAMARAAAAFLPAREAPLSHGRRHRARHHHGGRLRYRHVRLRLSDALRAQRARDDARRRVQHSQRCLSRATSRRSIRPATATSARPTRARTLHHLFRANEMLGPRLLSYHNVYVLNDLMRGARDAIERGAWLAYRDGILLSSLENA